MNHILHLGVLFKQDPAILGVELVDSPLENGDQDVQDRVVSYHHIALTLLARENMCRVVGQVNGLTSDSLLAARADNLVWEDGFLEEEETEEARERLIGNPLMPSG